MRDLLERKLFPRVMKPGRYAGGEPGQIVKSPDGRTGYLHAYPDKYEIGMSYVGLQSLYHIINSDDRFLCERTFAIDADAELIMRAEKIPLFSLESGRPCKQFDALGFTLVDETVYTNVLAMIDLAGLQLRSADRTDDDPLVMAGGPSVYNPEPLAPFIDLFFIGDAEEGLPQMLGILHDMKSASRREKLEAICRSVDSVYIPAFYDDHHRPVESFAPKEIAARVIPELKPEYYPDQPLLPLIETVHDHLAVEVMRGCPQGCRFCMAGSIYRPVRVRSQKDIVRQVETQLQKTGFGEVTLLSLSSSDYPDIDTLATRLARKLEPSRISLSLPSLRPGTISPALLDAVGRVRRSGFTIAPEAGTERLRLFLRKDFPDEAIYDSARLAMKKGWTTIKLYFMIGLPTETEEDLLGIVNLCRNMHSISRGFEQKININVTISPFNPKPHTPFQWDEILPEEEIFGRIKFLRSRMRLGQIRVKYSDTRLSQLVGVLGRGDRSLADVIETAFKNDCRFDGWSETFDYAKWSEAFEARSVPMEQWLKPIPFSKDLPWSHIRKGVSVEHLKSERERTSTQLKDFKPYSSESTDTEAAANGSVSFGRSKKKTPTRNLAAPTKNRARLRWGRGSRLRYMSHLDNLRLMERLIRQARLPIAFSQGFNPSMKLSFGPPLPLGFTSEAEYVDITLDTQLLPHMMDELKAVLPDELQIFDAKIVISKSASLSAALNRAVYLLDRSLDPSLSDLEAGIARTLGSSELIIERTSKKGVKKIDIRPAIYELEEDDRSLKMVLGLGEGGYVRPNELLNVLLQDTDDLITDSLPFHRLAAYRMDASGAIVDPMDI